MSSEPSNTKNDDSAGKSDNLLQFLMNPDDSDSDSEGSDGAKDASAIASGATGSQGSQALVASYIRPGMDLADRVVIGLNHGRMSAIFKTEHGDYIGASAGHVTELDSFWTFDPPRDRPDLNPVEAQTIWPTSDIIAMPKKDMFTYEPGMIMFDRNDHAAIAPIPSEAQFDVYHFSRTTEPEYEDLDPRLLDVTIDRSLPLLEHCGKLEVYMHTSSDDESRHHVGTLDDIWYTPLESWYPEETDNFGGEKTEDEKDPEECAAMDLITFSDDISETSASNQEDLDRGYAEDNLDSVYEGDDGSSSNSDSSSDSGNIWIGIVRQSGDSEFGEKGDSGSLVYAKQGDTIVPLGVHVVKPETMPGYSGFLSWEAWAIIARQLGKELRF